MRYPLFKYIRLRYVVFLLLLGIVFYWQRVERFSLENMVYNLVGLYFQIGHFVAAIDSATSPWRAYFPLIITGLFVSFVFLFPPPIPNFVRCSLIIATFLCHTAYIVFRATIFNLHGPLNIISSSLLYFTEVFHYVTMCCFYLQMAWSIDRRRLADRGEHLVVSGQYRPSVAFFVPTLNEPVDVLRRTLAGCLAVDYEPKTVYLLDDGSRTEMRELASGLGCRYIARSDRTGAKAGNLTNALKQTDEELVAFLDCDNVPAKNFLRRMVGLFADPKVALTISSLHYFNAQEKKKIVGIEMLTAADHANSLGNSQSGRDNFNALLCFGTSYIARREALDKIGGIPSETICEDWATSIKLQNRKLGFKTYFVNEVLSTGLAAENMSGFVRQRLRWCQGTIQALYSSTNPLTAEGLNRRQRLVHFFGILYYLLYPVIFISWLIPLFYFFFGIVPFEANVQQFTYFFFPYFVMLNAMYVVFSRRLSVLVSSQVYDFLLCWPFTLVAVKSLIFPFGKRFDVTPKGIRDDKVKPLPSLSIPLLILLLLYLSGIVYGFSNVQWLSTGGAFGIYVFWAIYRIIFFWLAFNAAVNLPQQRRSVRFDHDLRCDISTRDGDFIAKAVIEDLSENGAKICCTDSRLPEVFLVSIPSLSLKHVQATVIRSSINDGTYGIAFQKPGLSDQCKLIEYLYCEPGRWEKYYLPEKTAVRALLRFFSVVK